MTSPHDITENVKRIFDLHVISGLDPLAIAAHLGITHQAVYAVLNSVPFGAMVKRFNDALEKHIDDRSRTAILKTKKTFIDAAPEIAERLVEQAKLGGANEAATLSARKAALQAAGVATDAPSTVGGRPGIIFVVPGDPQYKELAAEGAITIEAPDHGTEAGTSLGDGIKRLIIATPEPSPALFEGDSPEEVDTEWIGSRVYMRNASVPESSLPASPSMSPPKETESPASPEK